MGIKQGLAYLVMSSITHVSVDKVLKQEAEEIAQNGRDPVLKKTRYCILKRKSNLTDNKKMRIKELLS